MKLMVRSVVVRDGGVLDLTGEVDFLGAVPTVEIERREDGSEVRHKAFEVMFCSRLLMKKAGKSRRKG